MSENDVFSFKECKAKAFSPANHGDANPDPSACSGSPAFPTGQLEYPPAVTNSDIVLRIDFNDLGKTESRLTNEDIGPTKPNLSVVKDFVAKCIDSANTIEKNNAKIFLYYSRDKGWGSTGNRPELDNVKKCVETSLKQKN
jgi:hypothetical protein